MDDLDPERIYEDGVAAAELARAERERHEGEILAALQSTDAQAPDPYRWDQAAGRWVDEPLRRERRHWQGGA